MSEFNPKGSGTSSNIYYQNFLFLWWWLEVLKLNLGSDETTANFDPLFCVVWVYISLYPLQLTNIFGQHHHNFGSHNTNGDHNDKKFVVRHFSELIALGHHFDLAKDFYLVNLLKCYFQKICQSLFSCFFFLVVGGGLQC